MRNVIVDLRGCDYKFLEECEAIFEINTWLDQHEGSLLLDWIKITVTEVISLYTTNPMTALGTLKEDPLFDSYTGLDQYSAEQIRQFCLAYRVFAATLITEFDITLSPIFDEALHDYDDVQVRVVQYHLDTLVIDILGVIEDEPFL